MLSARLGEFGPTGYPYGNDQNAYFSKSQKDFNKLGFPAEGQNFENIYQLSPEGVPQDHNLLQCIISLLPGDACFFLGYRNFLQCIKDLLPGNACRFLSFRLVALLGLH